MAAGFFGRGVEARHLRMYRNHAEREAVLFGQVLMPYVRQRNPEARARMQEELVELAALGRRLRTVLLRERCATPSPSDRVRRRSCSTSTPSRPRSNASPPRSR